VSLSAVAFSAVLTPEALAIPVPPLLASAALKSALGLVGAATVSCVLAENVLHSSKLASRLGLLVWVCLGTLGVGLAVWGYHAWTTPADENPPAAKTPPQDPDPTKRPRSWRLQTNFQAPREQFHALAFSPDGTILATAGALGQVKLWDAKSGKHLRDLQDHQSPVLALAFSADGKKLTSAGSRAEVYTWDLQRGKQESAVELGPVGLSGAVFSPDGKTLAGITSPFITGIVAPPEQQGRFQPIQLWDIKSKKPLRGFAGHALVTAQLAFSPDGKTLVSAGARPRGQGAEEKGSPIGVTVAETRLWDVATGREVMLDRGGMSLAFSADGKLLAFGSYDEDAQHTCIELWDMKTQKKAKVFPAVGDSVAVLCFSPDGKQLMAGGIDRVVQVWDISGARKQLTLEGHQTTLAQVAFSPDGNLLATADWNGVVRIWTSREVK
jgi:WD40 repeat protein